MSNSHTTFQPTVAVIIVSYNTAALTTKALQAVFASEDVRLSVYVVDNASTDRTLSTLRRRFKVAPNQAALVNLRAATADARRQEIFPGIVEDVNTVNAIETASQGDHELSVILATKNLGFGRANNLAAAWTTADYVFFLNSDTEVKPTTIAALVTQFRRQQEKQSDTTAVIGRWQRRLDNLGIVAAQLLNPDGSVQRQGGALPNASNIFRWITFLDDLPGMNQLFSSYQHQDSEMRSISRRSIAKVGWVGGTAMMISRPCLEEIGGFDPAIFMYGEDVDLCWRATLRHWDVAVTSEAEVTHIGSASSSQKNAILGEISGLVYMWEKHHSQSELRLLKWALRFGLQLRVLLFGILHRYGQQRIYREALALV